MTSYKQTTKFNKTMRIPEAILHNLQLEEENNIYWYIHVENNTLQLSLSINQETIIPHTVYKTKRKFNNKTNKITFPRDIITILKLEEQPIQWQIHKEKPDITITTPHPIPCPTKKLNKILTSKTSTYKENNNTINIPRQILNTHNSKKTKPTLCHLYKHDNKNIFILSDKKNIIKDSEYTPTLIFPAHITSQRGQKQLTPSFDLKEYLKLKEGEEINWQTYYHQGKTLIGFTKKYKNQDKETKLKLSTKNNKYYLQIPPEIQTILKNKKTLLWKRYKHKTPTKINITPDEPRYYKHRKTGKTITTTTIKQEKTPIPEDIIKNEKITEHTQVNWKLNTEDKRYKYIELTFT